MSGALGIALLMQASALLTTPDAANWSCATPLVEKNYRQPVDSKQLALRIADECAVSYRPIDPATPDHPVEGTRKLSHTYSLQRFTAEIETAILKSRRRDAIQLKK